MDNRGYGKNSMYCDLCFQRCRGIYHVIEQGDTLYSLGQRYRVSVSDIMRANPYVNVYNLRIGEELCIPVKGPEPREEEMVYTDMGWQNGSMGMQPDNSMVRPDGSMGIQPNNNMGMVRPDGSMGMQPNNNMGMIRPDGGMGIQSDYSNDMVQPDNRGITRPGNFDIIQPYNENTNNNPMEVNDRNTRTFQAEDLIVEEKEIKEENQFSEDDSLKNVMEKLGISMADLLKCASKKTD